MAAFILETSFQWISLNFIRNGWTSLGQENSPNSNIFCCKRIVENALLSALYRIIFALMNSLFRYWSQIVSNIRTQYIFSFSCDETYMIEENYGYEGKLFTTILWCQDSFLCIILYMCWKVLTYWRKSIFYVQKYWHSAKNLNQSV